MELITLLRREINHPVLYLLVFLTISGISGTLVISIINSAAENIANNELRWEFCILFILATGILFSTKRYVLDRSAEIVASVISQIRYRLADQVRRTELDILEKSGDSSIYARITQDATIISNTSSTIINSIQEIIMIFFVLLYIASVSVWSFFLITIGIFFGASIYWQRAKIFRENWRLRSIQETEFFNQLGHILKGFKEIKMNRKKNESVFNNFVKVNDETEDLTVRVNQFYNITLIYTQMFFYFLIGLIVFALPQLHSEHSDVILKVVASVLFILGPLDNLMYSIPMFGNASNSAERIMELENQLEKELKKLDEIRLNPDSPAAYEQLNFQDKIVLNNLVYQYPARNNDEAPFRIGPINLNFRKGELIFITGGNGSGKSTFMKLFTGLYKPLSGEILLDPANNTDNYNGQIGTLIGMRNYQQYQNMFSIIFSEYHLFDKIYGVEDKISPQQVAQMLESMELSKEKTNYKDGAFTNIHLSSGQRKRLALATSLLEDKDIYIFDEVAADLDPAFRDKFYYEILGELRARHKTVFVVSHDKHYWTTADRVIEFKNGKVSEYSETAIDSILTIKKA